jgi:DNA-3-methyladenine glycosylase I
MKQRCAWVGASDLELKYHDTEWGKPVRDDRLLFEMLTLEGAQSGLSWSTILNKRAAYKKAFSDFDALKITGMRDKRRDALMNNEGLVRHKSKLDSVFHNARIFLEVQKDWGSFAEYVWSFSHNAVIQNKQQSVDGVPSKTPVSELMSKDMKKRGFKFVGPTVCYAYMQGIGMVNDHTVDCFRYKKLSK